MNNTFDGGNIVKIQEIIDYLEKQGEWVNRQYTRDHILIGNSDLEIEKVIVCWVATMDVIKQAIQQQCHFIITHENPFYMNGTSIPTEILHSQRKKIELLNKYQISVYRCHDLWDLYPQIGVRDQWAKLLDLSFKKESSMHSYIRISQPFEMSVQELARHIIQKIEAYDEFGVEVIGNLQQTVHCLGIGTGACTDVIEMYRAGADVCLVSDDGINNWVHTQWAMDHQLPLIVVNHLTSEAAGIKKLSDYLSHQFPDIEFHFIKNDYGIHHIEKAS